MAVKVTFNSNLDEVLHLFESAKAKTLLDIGVTVQGKAAEGSPVRTGDLRDSWTVEVDEEESYVAIGVPLKALPKGRKGENYAKFVELGTSRGQIPRHMLRNAVNDSKDEFPNIAKINFKNA